MSAPPPNYQTATQSGPNASIRPALNVTSPQGETHRAKSNEGQHPGNLRRGRSNDTIDTISTDGGYDEGPVDEDGRRSMDDLGRELPKGWVRCFDANSQHHFYVDESTKRSIWVHPYDDPGYLRSLPDTHPANPNSQQAQAIQKRAEQEEAMARKMKEDKAGARSPPAGGMGSPGSKTSHESRNWIQRQKDKLVGTPEERAAAKAEKRRVEAERQKQMREAQEQYLKKREELIQQHLKDPQSQYSTMYAAPSSGYSRSGGNNSPYAYGYGGGYGRRQYGYGGYGGGMGMGLPLVGGLAGGMLLGDMMGGGMGMGGMGMGYGGGFGGGCGGGGFGGGGGGGCGGGGM